ncbi:MFS transporter [soil metagenome]
MSELAQPGAKSNVLACLTGNLVGATPMFFATFGIFLVPIADTFGWSRTAVGVVFLIFSLCGLVAYPVVGRIADRVGVRRIVLIGNPLFALAMASLAWLQPVSWLFYLQFVVLGIVAAIPGNVLYAKVVANWFSRQRGVMFGVTAGIGNGGGATVMPIVTIALMSQFGWRGAFVGLAIVMVGLGWPMFWLFLRDRPAEPVAQAAVPSAPLEGVDLSRAARTPTFAILLLAIGLGAGGGSAVFSHVVPILTDRGFSPETATGVLSAFALTCVVWQVLLGFGLDRVQSPKLAAPLFLCAIVGVLLMIHAESLPLIVIGAMLAGIGLGTEYAILPYWVPRYFGRKAYGAIYGAVYGSITLVMGIAPVIMDVVFDRVHSYNPALYGVCAALFGGSLLVLALKPYAYDRDGRPVTARHWPHGAGTPAVP